MAACAKLHLFTWSYVNTDTGEAVLSPICPLHSRSRVHIEKSGANDVVVTCPEQQPHPLNMCSRAEFEAEREEARKTLRGEQK